MITRSQIKETDYFKSLNSVKQKIITQKHNVQAIELGFNMSNLRGKEFWIKTTNPRADIKGIVLELIK